MHAFLRFLSRHRLGAAARYGLPVLAVVGITLFRLVAPLDVAPFLLYLPVVFLVSLSLGRGPVLALDEGGVRGVETEKGRLVLDDRPAQRIADQHHHAGDEDVLHEGDELPRGEGGVGVRTDEEVRRGQR